MTQQCGLVRHSCKNDIVVTGGAGAIGARLVRKLLGITTGRITVIDNLTSGYRWLLPEDERVSLVTQDICNIDSLNLNFKDALVFHLAAFFANQNSVDHPKDDLHTNGLGTLAVLKAAADGGAQRVVYASAGCSIAGHGVDAPISEEMPVSLHLDTPYQITKALGEFYCNYFASSLSTVRCRFFNSYGPGEVPGRYRNVIPNFLWWAMHGKALPITGTGNETRDFIFVDDLIDGLVAAALVPEAHGEAFNLGTGIQTKIGDLANLVVRLTGSTAGIEYRERRAWDHSLRRQANNTKAKQVLGISPSVTLEEGVSQAYRWFQENYEDIAQCVDKEFA